MTTSLLIAEPPLQILPTLACRIGVFEALVLQQLHYLSLRPSNRDGWVCKTTDEWCAVFPFLSQRSLERAFSSLRKQQLLLSEPVPGGGRRTRLRVDHDAVEKLVDDGPEEAEAIRQFGGTNPPIWRDQSANLAGPIRQFGGEPLCIEGKAEGTTDAASQQRARRVTDDDVETVFSTWQAVTGRTDALLDVQRRRRIRKAIRLKGLDACCDAVKGWRHSAWHRGANPDGVPKNDLGILLADAESIERFCELERHRGDSSKLVGGNVADRCPGPAPAAVLAKWAPIAAGLAERVPESTHEIWLRPLHPHADVDGTLLVGVPSELLTWVRERFRAVLDAAAAGTPVTLVECAGVEAA